MTLCFFSESFRGLEFGFRAKVWVQNEIIILEDNKLNHKGDFIMHILLLWWEKSLLCFFRVCIDDVLFTIVSTEIILTFCSWVQSTIINTSNDKRST